MCTWERSLRIAGPWDDFTEYMQSDKYVRMNRMQQMSFPLMAWVCNRNIEKLKSGLR